MYWLQFELKPHKNELMREKMGPRLISVRSGQQEDQSYLSFTFLINTVSSLNRIHRSLSWFFRSSFSTMVFGTVVRLLVPLIVNPVSVI